MMRIVARVLLPGVVLAAVVCGVSAGTAAALPSDFGKVNQRCDSKKIYKPGNTQPDECIRAIQADLRVFTKNPNLKTDGLYGPETEAAIRNFQSHSDGYTEVNGKEHPAHDGLAVDGIAGPKTTGLLGLEDVLMIGLCKNPKVNQNPKGKAICDIQ